MRNFPRFLATFRKNREFKASYVNLFVFFLVLCVCTILWFSCEKINQVQLPYGRSLDPPLQSCKLKVLF